MTSAQIPLIAGLDRLRARALALGVAVLLVAGLGAFFDPAQFFRAYLSSYIFFLGIALGSLTILMLCHLTGGAWGFLIRRVLEAGARTLPLLALLFVPIALGLDYLYVWAPADGAGTSETQRIYLDKLFFWIRALVYFTIWIGLAYLASSWSWRQDETAEPRFARRLTRLSGPGLVAYGLTVTFSSVDWVMSLEPSFRSSIFGPLTAAGHVLSGHAFAVVVVAWLAASPTFAPYISKEVMVDLGNLLLTFLIIWAYMAWFQFMLIWMGNLPYDIAWYLPRSQDGWQWVVWALFVLHFAVPFFLLLLRDVKENPRTLARVAGVILFMHLVYSYFQVMPAFAPASLSEHWLDFLTPVGLSGIWLGYFLWQLTRWRLLPLHDPNQLSAVHLQQLAVDESAREREVRHG